VPDRIIKESICTSDTIDQLTWFEEVFWYRLTVNCDDFGRFDARPAILRSRLFPLKEGITDAAIIETLNKFRTVGLVNLYVFEARPYLQLETWAKHQRQRATKSKYPAPNESTLTTSADTCRQLPSNVPEYESECESERVTRKRFTPPIVEEVSEYCKERRNGIDAEYFCDFYQAKNWMVGKNKMKDWKAAVRTWEKKDGIKKTSEVKYLD